MCLKLVDRRLHHVPTGRELQAKARRPAPPPALGVELAFNPPSGSTSASSSAPSPGSSGGAASTAPTNSAATSVTPIHHVVGKNSIVVHSRHYLGVRAGFGYTGTFGPERDLITEPGISGQVVRQQNYQGDFAFPLHLTYYPWT